MEPLLCEKYIIDDISCISSMNRQKHRISLFGLQLYSQVASKSVQCITLRHQIAARIRQAILEGRWTGERLVERTLGTEMGASVTAVREAIIQLEAEGLITKRTNTTTNVTVLTAEEITQTFVVRHALERIAMIEAARRAKPDDIRRLTEILAG